MRHIASLISIFVLTALLSPISGETAKAPAKLQFSENDWLILGAFPNDEGGTDSGLGRDFLAGTGGEAGAKPLALDRVEKRRWMRIAVSGGHVDFRDFFPAATNAVAYAYAEISAAEAEPVVLKFGSDDGIRIWCNGELAADRHLHRALVPDEEFAIVNLRPGINRLLVKVEQLGGGWEFALHLRRMAEEAAGWVQAKDRRIGIEVPVPAFADAAEASCRVVAQPSFAVSEPVRLVVRDRDGKEVGARDCRTGETVALGMSAGARGIFKVEARPTNPGIGGSESIFLVGDRAKLVAELVALARSTKAEDRRAEATLAFLADELEGKLHPSLSTPERDMRAMAGILELASAIKKGGWKADSFPGQRQRAYRSPIDSSLQPYTVYLPKSYDPAKKYSLVLALHGFSDSDWDGASKLSSYCPEGFIVVAPFGRGDLGFRSIGEVDVLDVLDIAQRDYSIDPSRIYVMGWSMGGMGAWRMGLLYSDRFAAIAPFCGWCGTDSLGNLKNTPTLIVHGDADQAVPVGMDRDAAAALRRLGAPVEYRELSGAGHNVWSKSVLDAAKVDPFAFFAKRSLDPWPKRIDFTVSDLRYARHFWVRAEELSESPKAGRIEARLVGSRRIEVSTALLSAIALDLGHPGLASSGTIEVDIDGSSLSVAAGARELELLRGADGSWKPGPGLSPERIRHTGEGATELFLAPLTIVYGSAVAERTPLLRLAAETMADWSPTERIPLGSKTGRFIVLSDREAIAQDRLKGNLILIGDAKENALTAAQLEYAGARFDASSLSIGGQKITGSGMLLAYPNARAPGRLAGVLVLPPKTDSASVKETFFYAILGMYGYYVDETATRPNVWPDAAVFDELGAIIGKGPSWSGSFDRNWENLRRWK